MENKSSNKAVVPSMSGEKEIGFKYIPKEDGLWEIEIAGKKVMIKQKDLFSIVYYGANEEQLDQLTPVQNTEVRVYYKQHKIKLLKDMKKGQEVVATCEISVPVTVEQGLKGLVESKKKSKLILPRMR